MAELILTSGKIGLSNINQKHYLRNHSFNIQGDSLNKLVASRIGTSDKANPGAVLEVSLKTSGVSANTVEEAYIEGGWGESRGVAYLEFDLENAGIVSNTVGIYGYLYGGDPVLPGAPLPLNIRFVPVRSWMIESTGIPDHNGFIEKTSVMRGSSQFLLDNPESMQGNYSIRPKDVIDSSLGYTLEEDANDPIGGGSEPNMMAGASSAILRTQGVVSTDYTNINPVKYGEKLIGSAMSAQFNLSNNVDAYDALSEVRRSSTLSEQEVYQNTFFKTMSSNLGLTSLQNFEGYTFYEIESVFPTFNEPGVINTQLTDLNNCTLEDYRLSTNEHNGANYQTLIANDLLYIAVSLMVADKSKLSFLQFTMDNNTPSGQIMINDLPIIYQMGEAYPLMSNDQNWIYNVESTIQDIAYYLYTKYNSPYMHERRLVNVSAEISIFGESKISVFIDGDPSNMVTLNFFTAAANRTDPTLSNLHGSQAITQGFYSQLKNELGF